MYRTRYQIDVLHENPIPEAMEIEDVIHEGYEGSYVLDVKQFNAEPLSDGAMRAALQKAGSTPDFFFPEGD
jgi:hypothetical protein